MNRITLRNVSVLSTAALLLAACDGAQSLDPVSNREPNNVTEARSAAQTDAPSNVIAAASSTSQIDIGWQDNATTETNFQIHRSTTGATGVFSVLATLAANARSHSDSGLSSAVEYCYKVRSARSTGKKTSYSMFSNTSCATIQLPPPPPPPPAPAAPTIINATPYNSNSVFLEFIDNSTNEDGFRVYRSFDGGATWSVWATASRDAAGVYDSYLQNELTVCYRLVAFNAGGDSSPSNRACTTPPASPSNVTARTVDPSTFELRWTDNSAVEDGYEVRYSYRVNADGFSCGGDLMNAECATYEDVVAVLGPGTVSYRITAYLDEIEAAHYVVYARSDGGFSYGATAVYVDP